MRKELKSGQKEASGKWQVASGKCNCAVGILCVTKLHPNMLQLSHKKLQVYQFALQLVREVYNHTKNYPRDEQFVLVSQLRRAAISVCSNIAEGAARISKVEKKRFYEISRSSLVEIDTQIEISLILNYIQKDEIHKLEEYLESVFKMLSKMIGNIEMASKK